MAIQTRGPVRNEDERPFPAFKLRKPDFATQNTNRTVFFRSVSICFPRKPFIVICREFLRNSRQAKSRVSKRGLASVHALKYRYPQASEGNPRYLGRDCNYDDGCYGYNNGGFGCDNMPAPYRQRAEQSHQPPNRIQRRRRSQVSTRNLPQGDGIR